MSENRICQRITDTATALEDYYRNVHRLRGMVLGDPASINDGERSSAGNNDLASRLKRPFPARFGDYFIRVEDMEEGQVNDVMQTIRTLAFQTTHHFPDIEIGDLHWTVASLHAQYILRRGAAPPLGCGMVNNMALALFEFLIGGLGGVMITPEDNRPAVRYFDSLDFKWDQMAKFPEQSRWASLSIRQPWHVWETMFGKRVMNRYRNDGSIGSGEDTHEDTPCELEWYYDVIDEGTEAVYFKTAINELHDMPVYEGENPNRMDIDGEDRPFLPFETMFFLLMPSMQFPTGLAQDIFPAQQAAWMADKTVRILVERMRAFFQYEEGTLSEEDESALEEGDIGAIIRRKAGSAEIKATAVTGLNNEVIKYKEDALRSMQKLGGSNPYSSGAPQDVDFAAETNAIERQAGLMAGTIDRCNAGLWANTVRKFVAVGKLVDDKPFKARMPGPDGEDLTVIYGPDDPIKDSLDPSADFLVREDSMRFVSPEQKAALALKDLEVAMAHPDRPDGIEVALKDYYIARGVKDVGKRLKKVEPVTAPGMPGMPADGSASGQAVGAATNGM